MWILGAILLCWGVAGYGAYRYACVLKARKTLAEQDAALDAELTRLEGVLARYDEEWEAEVDAALRIGGLC